MSEPRRLVDEEGSAAGELLRRVQPPTPAPGAAARNWRALEARRAAVGRTGRWGWFAAGGLVAAACAVVVVSLSSPTVESFVVTPHGGARVRETVAALKVVEALEFGRIDVDANRAPVEVQTPVVVVVHVTRGEVYLRSRERWLGEGVREELRGVVTTSARDGAATSDAQEIAGGREPLGARATTDSAARDAQQVAGGRDVLGAGATTDSAARDAQQRTGVREASTTRATTDSAARDAQQVAGTREGSGATARDAQQATGMREGSGSTSRDAQQMTGVREVPGARPTTDSAARDAQQVAGGRDVLGAGATTDSAARDAQQVAGGRDVFGAGATTDSAARDARQMTGVREGLGARATTDSAARDAQQMTGEREVPGARPTTDSAARDAQQMAGSRDAPGPMALDAQQVTLPPTDSVARDSQRLRTPEIPGTPDSTTRDAQRTTKTTDQDQLRLALSLRRTDPRRSAQLLRELAASPSHGEVALYELGRLQSSSLGDPSSAVATFREARARFPAGALLVEVSVSLIEALLAAKSPAAALTELDALAALPVARERPEELAVLRGDILRNLGRPADALRVLEPLAKGTSAWAARALFLLSDCQSRLGRSDEARVTLRQYLRRFPTGAQASDVKRALGE